MPNANTNANAHAHQHAASAGRSYPDSLRARKQTEATRTSSSSSDPGKLRDWAGTPSRPSGPCAPSRWWSSCYRTPRRWGTGSRRSAPRWIPPRWSRPRTRHCWDGWCRGTGPGSGRRPPSRSWPGSGADKTSDGGIGRGVNIAPPSRRWPGAEAQLGEHSCDVIGLVGDPHQALAASGTPRPTRRAFPTPCRPSP
jgi:hypothetical protein